MFHGNIIPERTKMPTYEYACDKCGHRYEKFQNMSAEADTVCPSCGAAVRRLIGAGAGIIFKGNGFYQNDYKKPSTPPSECAACSSCPSCPTAKE
jgi:putative FmdB family regulatory protein